MLRKNDISIVWKPSVIDCLLRDNWMNYLEPPASKMEKTLRLMSETRHSLVLHTIQHCSLKATYIDVILILVYSFFCQSDEYKFNIIYSYNPWLKSFRTKRCCSFRLLHLPDLFVQLNHMRIVNPHSVFERSYCYLSEHSGLLYTYFSLHETRREHSGDPERDGVPWSQLFWITCRRNRQSLIHRTSALSVVNTQFYSI